MKKKKKAPRAKKKEEEKNGRQDRLRRIMEVLGIILLGVTVIIIISLISYHPEDRASATFSTSSDVRNFAGPVGALLADYLIQYLGASAVLIPILSFYLAIVLLVPGAKKPWRTLSRFSGLALIILVLTAWLAILAVSDPLFGSSAPSGGLVGQAVNQLMLFLFSRPGEIVVLAALTLVGLIMATGVSLHRAWSHLGGKLPRKRETKTLRTISPRPKGPPRKKKGMEEEAPVEVKKKGPEIRIAPPGKKPARQMDFNFQAEGNFKLPSMTLLDPPPMEEKKISRENLLMNSKILEKKLRDFGIQGEVTQVHPGPVITMYEYAPAPGIKVNRIVNLADDLALAMSAYSVRVVAPIPGKSVVGIEIPNTERELVHLLEILTSEQFKKTRSQLAFSLGKDIFGRPVVGDLIRMPHLLIAGATGSGKSVMLNTLLCSILFRATPAHVRFLLIDPKMVEMSSYEGIPHLITPVVTNPKKASWALKNVVGIMEERYKMLAEKNAKSIESYNQQVRKASPEDVGELMAYLVVVIDELADLMVMASSDVEDSITRLAQMARAVGIHLVIATQRPSVNVITGVIKANLPTRISFQVSSKNDSRIILDANGAEQLLGKGDMLYLPPGTSKLQRVHGAYISETEIRKVVDFIKHQAAPKYDESILKPVEKPGEEELEEETDEKYQEAIDLVRRTGQASISMIQRRLRVGYNRAARMVERMEQEGIISSADGVKPRRIL
jgi:S-DNA-T family DNA segregation ATPase FtsK/SpoIIIE